MEAVTEHENRGGKSRGKSDEETGLDWEAIHGLMEDAIYGGRVDNAFDVRVLRAYCASFFADRLASDSSAGADVLYGTPLRMPSTPDYNAFKKIIAQLPDNDAPYVFSLPDNIERSLQRNNSVMLIKQLSVLSSMDGVAAKFDREKWRAQLGPIMDLWQALLSGTPGIVTRRSGGQASTSSGGGGGGVGGGGGSGSGSGKKLDPVDDFVTMELDLAGDVCSIVDLSLTALKKVLFGSGLLTPAIQAAAACLLSGIVLSVCVVCRVV